MTGILEQSIQEISDKIKAELPTDDLELVALDSQISYIFINTIIDLDRLHKEIIPCLKDWVAEPGEIDFIFPDGKRLDNLSVIIDELVTGSLIILAKASEEAGEATIYAIQMSLISKRAIDEPKVEKFILGPKESFIEDFATNIALLRRRVKDPKLVIRYFEIGVRSKTKAAVCYISDIAKPEWVEDIETKLKKIDIDAIFEQNDLMELIIDKTRTPFPRYELTESPISVARNINIGRISVFMEGSPFAASIPSLLLSMLYGSEYIFQGAIIRFAIRMLKLLAVFISVYSAAFYLSIVSVNTAILPTQFGLSIAKDQEGIPYAPFFEVMIFVIILDLFIEGTSNVPGMMGPAINVFGSLVIGQAAVESGLASKMIIIVTALTVIGTYFSSYQISYAFRLWKYPMIFGAGLLGLYGIMISTIIMLAHVCSMTSLGVPYLAPYAPLNLKDLLRGALWDRDVSKSRVRMSVYQPQDQVKEKGEPDK